MLVAHLSRAVVAKHVAHLRSNQGLEAGLIDIAQDLVLRRLHITDIASFLAFKGGTALRKFYAGNSGRFSTDLDFAVSDVNENPLVVTNMLCDAIDGYEDLGFHFKVIDRRGKKTLVFQSAADPLGDALPIKLDVGSAPWLPTQLSEWVPLEVHLRYGEPPLPHFSLVRLEENIAEKIARLNRTTNARDLVDLEWIASSGLLRRLDRRLIRRLVVLKIWVDEHGVKTPFGMQWSSYVGNQAFRPAFWLRARTESEFDREDVGNLSRNVPAIGEINATIAVHYAFLRELDQEEEVVAECNGSGRDVVLKLLADLPGKRMGNVF